MFPILGLPVGTHPLVRLLAFLLSAVVAAATLQVAWERPLLGLLALIPIAIWVFVSWLASRKMRRLFYSGDVTSVLNEWQNSFDRVPHAETMAPLLRATAYAAYGWVDKARDTLSKAERGPVWEAALEHRLFLDTLIATFDGHRDEAVELAARLDRLPVADGDLGARIQALRNAVGALARVFAHSPKPEDEAHLMRGSDASPLIYWAMRYGAAVLALDRGNKERARALIDGAPTWPQESCFRNFHTEIAQHAD